MKNADYGDVMLCGSRKNQRFGGTYRFHHQGERNPLSMNISTVHVPSSLISFALMMEAIRSSETLTANIVPSS
jgi:hypothetical protein